MYTRLFVLCPLPSQFKLYLALVDVVRSEEKLPVEVGLVDGVEIHHLDILETGKHQVLQQLTPLHCDSEHDDEHEHRRATKGIGPTYMEQPDRSVRNSTRCPVSTLQLHRILQQGTLRLREDCSMYIRSVVRTLHSYMPA